jgi:hypothetical protein
MNFVLPSASIARIGCGPEQEKVVLPIFAPAWTRTERVASGGNWS